MIYKAGTILLLVSLSLLLTACNDPGQESASASAPAKTRIAATPYALPSPPMMKSLSGATFDPGTYSDRLILINVWATWCGPCRIEMPDLEELQGHYDPDQFQVIGIAADEIDEVAKYLQTTKVTYPNYVGISDEVFAWSEKLGNRVVAVPFSALIDSTGVVRWTKTGGRILVDELEPVINELINENSEPEG